MSHALSSISAYSNAANRTLAFVAEKTQKTTIPRATIRVRATLGNGVSERVVWHVVKQYARILGITQLAPHDLRRSCAKLCHASGGELEQIQFLLGHVSVQTPSDTWAANNGFVEPSTTALASSRS